MSVFVQLDPFPAFQEWLDMDDNLPINKTGFHAVWEESKAKTKKNKMRGQLGNLFRTVLIERIKWTSLNTGDYGNF